MIFELNSSEGLGLMEMLAKSTGRKIENGVLRLPETFGKGYIKKIPLGPLMGMMIHQYQLTGDVKGKRAASKSRGDFITFSFRNVLNSPEDKKDHGKRGRAVQQLPSVQVSSGDVYFEMSFAAKTKINAIVINVHVDLLKDWINKEEGSSLLKTIIAGGQPYLYEEIISPAIQDTAGQILKASVSEELLDFYYKLKIQELIFLFFVELLKRKDIVNYPFNVGDIKIIYQIRDKVISDLTTPPNLPELASISGMSESKMHRLFKQIFGNTIYNYHQKLRINEAAYLIKNRNLSVSEAGYQLGFTNLSHFTRIFEKHIGLKPKKYSSIQ